MKMAKGGTLLMLTATDIAVLSGAHRNACIKLYGAVPMHNELCHETGVRILIGYAASVAAQFNFGIRVMLGMSYAHYFRVFLQLTHGSESALDSMKQMGYAYYCNKCGFRTLRKELLPSVSKCGECGAALGVFGRMWAGSIISKDDLSTVSSKLTKVKDSGTARKLLSDISDEFDIPLYYSIPKMTRLLKMPSVSPIAVMKVLQKKGFCASRTHFDLSSIKTDAPVSAIRNILKALG
jgi:tRNA (guanine26-N2/guanine27-N2)-dimethyltransferase